MSEYTVTVTWQRGDDSFTDSRYNRSHTWEFDGGVVVPASSSPHAVRPPYSNPDNVDPEEAFVAAISSCHMLSFLYETAKQGFVVDSYSDHAVGVLEKNEEGRQAITRATLFPQIVFSGDKQPTDADLEALHHAAHMGCFIANSIKTEVTVSGAWSMQAAAGAL